jgi:tRNA-2-methylthio-N6-dimethylallyladenosine synthase
MKKFHVTTFGCQMNEHDSERMKGMLAGLGYSETGERGQADLILFNTCSIRENADNRFITHLGEAKRLKAEDPARIVGVGVPRFRLDLGSGVLRVRGLRR